MYCRRCRYPLSGVGGRACPECGRTFDPADQRTFARQQWRVSIELLIRAVLIFTALGSLAVLSLSIWPGVLVDVIFWIALLSLVWLPLALIALALLGVFLYRRHRQGGLRSIPRREAMEIPTMIILTLVLLYFYVPRRLAFVLCRAAFESTAQAALGSGSGRTSVNSWVGIYWVNECAGDSSGTAFFRVYSSFDGIGPDITSYGFARRPSQHSTPFGSADYHVFHIVDDWYWFRVSDDWH